MQTRAGWSRWISGLFRTRGKGALRSRRAMSAPYSAWVEVLETRELLSASPTIQFTLNAPTSLISQEGPIYVAMYGSVASPVSNSNNLTIIEYIDWDTTGLASVLTSGDTVSVEQLNFQPNAQLPGTSSVVISIPDIPNGNSDLTNPPIPSDTYQLNGARLVFGVGHKPLLSAGAGGSVAAPAPSSLDDPNTALNYDFVEFTLDLAGMHINTSTVDQFGFPITVTAIPTTTIASGSNGVALPATTIDVASTDGFLPQGTFQVIVGGVAQTITYNGITDTQFLNCTGGSGTLATGQSVQYGTVSTYITSNGVGVQLDRQDVFNGFAPYVSGTAPAGTTSPFLQSLIAGNTVSAAAIYQPALASTALSANSGAGAITIQVYNVSPNDPNVAVNFGSTAITISSSDMSYDATSKLTTITVTPPSLTDCTVDVTVTSSGGTSPTYPNFAYYTFGTGGVPTVTGLSTNSAPILGGNKVLITGTNFLDPNIANATCQVLFGTTQASFTVLSTTEILAYVPYIGGGGTVNVTVVNNNQTATNTPSFTYVALLPTITRLSSSNAAPGSRIAVAGKNFVPNNTIVRFGTLAGTNVQVVNSSLLYVTVPQNGSGTVDVTVTARRGRLRLTSPITPEGQFTYPSLPAYSASNSLRLVNPSDILAIESNAPNSLYAKCEPGGQLPANTYYYVVTATSHTGEGVPSAVQNATSNGIPGYKSIALAWEPIFNANGYNIYRSTSSTGPFYFTGHVNGGDTTVFLDNGTFVQTTRQPPTNIYTYDPLASYFDSALTTFFNYYKTNTFNLTYGGVDFTGSTLTDAAGRTYLNVTSGSGASATSCKVYAPFFNTNTNNPNNPPPPPGLANNYETPGQMVFSGDGVFALDTGTNSGEIQNVIVAAFNRGIATNFSVSPTDWGDTPADYYVSGNTANFYAGYMHQSNVSISDNRPLSEGGPQPLAYGFSYDDQSGDGGNGYGSYFTTPASSPNPSDPIPNGTIAIVINFGSWTPPTGIKTVSPPEFNVYERPLNFAVQLTDQNGAAVMQGGKEITLRITGPFNQTSFYTLVTSPNGMVTGISTKSGRPVEIFQPGTYTLKFSADGLNLLTETITVDAQSIWLKRRLMQSRPQPRLGPGGMGLLSMQQTMSP